MPDSWANGSTRTWRKKRRRVLERDRHRCQLKLPAACDCTIRGCRRFHGCKTRADCVHHLDGKALGDDESRLVAACTPCNLHVGDPAKGAGGDPPPRQVTAW